MARKLSKRRRLKCELTINDIVQFVTSSDAQQVANHCWTRWRFLDSSMTGDDVLQAFFVHAVEYRLHRRYRKSFGAINAYLATCLRNFVEQRLREPKSRKRRKPEGRMVLQYTDEVAMAAAMIPERESSQNVDTTELIEKLIADLEDEGEYTRAKFIADVLRCNGDVEYARCADHLSKSAPKVILGGVRLTESGVKFRQAVDL